MRAFLIVLFLGMISCTEIEVPNPCAEYERVYRELRKDFDAYVDIWIRLDRYELKHSDLQEWISTDPERRYQKMIEYMDAHSECLDFL